MHTCEYVTIETFYMHLIMCNFSKTHSFSIEYFLNLVYFACLVFRNVFQIEKQEKRERKYILFKNRRTCTAAKPLL